MTQALQYVDDRYLSIGEVAERLGISVRSIERMVAANEIDKPRYVVGRRKYRLSQMPTLMDQVERRTR